MRKKVNKTLPSLFIPMLFSISTLFIMFYVILNWSNNKQASLSKTDNMSGSPYSHKISETHEVDLNSFDDDISEKVQDTNNKDWENFSETGKIYELLEKKYISGESSMIFNILKINSDAEYQKELSLNRDSFMIRIKKDHYFSFTKKTGDLRIYMNTMDNISFNFQRDVSRSDAIVMFNKILSNLNMEKIDHTWKIIKSPTNIMWIASKTPTYKGVQGDVTWKIVSSAISDYVLHIQMNPFIIPKIWNVKFKKKPV